MKMRKERRFLEKKWRIIKGIKEENGKIEEENEGVREGVRTFMNNDILLSHSGGKNECKVFSIYDSISIMIIYHKWYCQNKKVKWKMKIENILDNLKEEMMRYNDDIRWKKDDKKKEKDWRSRKHQRTELNLWRSVSLKTV